MKRDPDVIRRMLLQIEKEGQIIAEHGSEDGYHLHLLGQAGFLMGPLKSTGPGMTGETLFAGPLSLRGQEFLELCRDEQKWGQALAAVYAASGGHNFELIEAWLRAKTQ